MKRKTAREHIVLHPVISMLLLIVFTILLSFILSLFNFSATYNKIDPITLEYIPTTESVTSILNLRGIKYIFANTVSNFANFTVLSHLIIVLLGIGVMEYSGFLKTAVGLLTRHTRKNTITFVIILIGLLSSIIGNMPFLALIPLAALIFKNGKRNPNLGIIAAFSSLTCGYGLSIFFTSIDSSLSKLTVLSASVLDSSYSFSSVSLMLISTISIIIMAFVLTYITENVIVRKLHKYVFDEEDDTKFQVTRPQAKGLVLAGIGSVIYLIIIIYNIIPYLPLSGNFLNYSESLYIDKLFGANSFFADGFVFVITILFIIWGVLYGIGAKTINNNREFINSLGYSLNDIGKTLVFIFAASTFISIFKYTNIGNVITALLSNLVVSSGFSGLALVVLFFIAVMISTIFLPNPVNKWEIMSSQVVPVFLNAGISAEFCQVIFRFAESVTIGLTPLFAYFVVYMAYLERYNQEEKYFGLKNAVKYQLSYAIITFVILLAIIVLWYIISLPLGFGGTVYL